MTYLNFKNMADKVQKNQIADILLDFYDEYDSNVINRPMIPNIYAGKIIDSLREEPYVMGKTGKFTTTTKQHRKEKTMDKLAKVRAEVARIQLYTQSETLKQVLDYIDEVQKEEIPPKFPLISPKKCMYTKDDFTDEDRKVLCDGCKEECEYAQKEEPAPKILEDMLNAKTPAESLGISAEEHDKIIDLCLYGKEPEMVDVDDLPKEEPVSESLEKAATKYAQDKYMPVQTSQAFKAGAKWQQEKEYTCYEEAFEDGAKWKKEQILKDAVEGKVLINGMGNPILHLWDKGKHLIDKKVKVILIKED